MSNTKPNEEPSSLVATKAAETRTTDRVAYSIDLETKKGHGNFNARYNGDWQPGPRVEPSNPVPVSWMKAPMIPANLPAPLKPDLLGDWSWTYKRIAAKRKLTHHSSSQ